MLLATGEGRGTAASHPRDAWSLPQDTVRLCRSPKVVGISSLGRSRCCLGTLDLTTTLEPLYAHSIRGHPAHPRAEAPGLSQAPSGQRHVLKIDSRIIVSSCREELSFIPRVVVISYHDGATTRTLMHDISGRSRLVTLVMLALPGTPGAAPVSIWTMNTTLTVDKFVMTTSKR